MSAIRNLLFVTAAIVLVVSSPVAATTLRTLYTFKGGGDGGDPLAALIVDKTGALYGTAMQGGKSGCCGTVFKFDPSSSQFTTLYSFSGGADGAGPWGGLVFDGAGNLYGTTWEGGSFKRFFCSLYGCGTVFELNPSTLSLTTLHAFTNGKDGSSPFDTLVLGGDGSLYGDASSGGRLRDCNGYGCGTVFQLAPATKKFTTLHGFTGVRDGNFPISALTKDAGERYYGMTQSGGRYGVGVIYEIDSAGQESILYTFREQDGGGQPDGSLVRDGSGNLYGLALSGGANGAGTIFEFDPAAKKLTGLYAFTGGADGGNPLGTLVLDSSGNLYGVTVSGGVVGCTDDAGCGTAFKFDPATKTLTTLYQFGNGADGSWPQAGLVLRNGVLYGTTSEGGNSTQCDYAGCGTIFEIER